MGLSFDPPSPAVTLAEAKAHLRITGTQDDADLNRFIGAATQYIETETRSALVSNDYKLMLDGFPVGRELRLLRPPLVSVVSVKYLDVAGAEQTLATSLYTVDVASKPGRVVLKPINAWPATNGDANCVRIEYTAGYQDAAHVPDLLKQAVLLMVGHYFENREAAIDRRIDAVPLAVESIVNSFAFPECV